VYHSLSAEGSGGGRPRNSTWNVERAGDVGIFHWGRRFSATRTTKPFGLGTSGTNRPP